MLQHERRAAYVIFGAEMRLIGACLVARLAFAFLHNPAVEPTNNRSERAVRPAVIARKLSHGSKNIRGAEAFAAFTTVIQTAVKRGASSTFSALYDLIGSKTPAASSTKVHAPPS